MDQVIYQVFGLEDPDSPEQWGSLYPFKPWLYGAFCLLVLTVDVYLVLYRRYTTHTVRDSEVALRLNSLNETYLTQLRTLQSIISDSQLGNTSTNNDLLRSQSLKDLLKDAHYKQFETHVLQFRETSERIATAVKEADPSLALRFYRRVESWLDVLRTHWIQGQEDKVDTIRETHDGLGAASKVPHANDLTKGVSLLTNCPSASQTFIEGWEQSDEANTLIINAEKAVQGIKYTLQQVPAAALPDFGRQAVVACWELSVSSTRPNMDSKSWRSKPDLKLQSRESVLRSGGQKRTRIPKEHLEEGGRYRGICLLKMIFQEHKRLEGPYYGTGWVLDEETIVTAAHNLYTPASNEVKESYACEVTAYLGVANRCLTKDTVEQSQGKTVAIHWGYFFAGRRQNDMAIIRLKDPLKTATPIPWKPASLGLSNCWLRVVGYPGDLPNNADQGRVMYRSQGEIIYDLKDDDYLLSYNFDTYEGNSGSPILLVGTNAEFHAIGVHAYGAGQTLRNYGCALGHMGNHINAFLMAMDTAMTGSSSVKSKIARPVVESFKGSNVPGLKKVTVPYKLVPDLDHLVGQPTKTFPGSDPTDAI